MQKIEDLIRTIAYANKSNKEFLLNRQNFYKFWLELITGKSCKVFFFVQYFVFILLPLILIANVKLMKWKIQVQE